MSSNEVILRFNEVSFAYSEKKVILEETSFSLREGNKVTIMGQNGAGKSTLIKLISGELTASKGLISKDPNIKIAVSKQTLTIEEKKLKLRDYYKDAFDEVPYNLDKQIKDVLEIVNLTSYDLDRELNKYSGGQQARILLSKALIQEPDLLILDEPTNNLDQDGIDYLTGYLIMYDKTCLVISHDEEFLNSFSDGVLYLDNFTHKIEQYTGNYYDVLEEIDSRVERERKLNARMNKQIEDQKNKINFFANKGGKMRKLASKLRDQVEVAKENIVEVRREDRTIRNFEIPIQEELSGELLGLDTITILKNGDEVSKKINLSLRRGNHIQIKGPNGIGKTTLLNSIANKTVKDIRTYNGLKIGYYTQDFHNLNFDQTVKNCLIEAMGLDVNEIIPPDKEHHYRSIAAGFLIDSSYINHQIGDLSEGQKALVSFARLTLLKPGLLILDEPTNHVNFRHIPVIAQALSEFEGAMILVSHVSDFVSQIRIDETIELDKIN
jgi:ATP-binding cassette subfamily F protein 3